MFVGLSRWRSWYRTHLPMQEIVEAMEIPNDDTQISFTVLSLLADTIKWLFLLPYSR